MHPSHVGQANTNAHGSSIGGSSSPSDATRFMLYHSLVCILSGNETAANSSFNELKQSEGVTEEHLQHLKRAATEQNQYVAVWTLNKLILDARHCTGQDITHDSAKHFIEGVTLLVHTLNGAPSSQGARYIVEGLLKQIPFELKALQLLVRCPSNVEHCTVGVNRKRIEHRSLSLDVPDPCILEC